MIKKLLLYVIFNFYYRYWAKIHNFFELKEIPKNKLLEIEKFIVNYQYGNKKLYEVLWKNITRNLTWTKDTITSLFDCIQHPYHFLYTTKGDCEDFARLGFYIFQNSIPNEKSNYIFSGFYFIIKNNFSAGHCVAIWKNSFGEYIAISNNEISKFNKDEISRILFELFGDKEYFLVITDKDYYIKRILTEGEFNGEN